MHKTIAIVVAVSAIAAFGDVSDYQAQEAKLLAEREKLEKELQEIKDDNLKEMWSSGVDVTEAALEAERQRRREAKFKLDSFAGYKFGSYNFHDSLDRDYSKTEKLMFPIRALTEARLYYTPQHKELWKVVLIGYVDGATSRDDCYMELAKIMEIINGKYGVDLWQYIYVGEKKFKSEFHKEIGRMDFDGSVCPSCCKRDKDGRKLIKFTLAVSNFAPFDKEDKKELKLSVESGTDRL